MARNSFVRSMVRSSERKEEREINERDVVYVHIGGKPRPTICLRRMPGKHGDFLVCAVSTQLNQYIKGFDEIVQPSPDTGIIEKSVIRLGCIERVEKDLIPGSIGMIPIVQHRRLLKKLSNYLIKAGATTSATTPVT